MHALVTIQSSDVEKVQNWDEGCPICLEPFAVNGRLIFAHPDVVNPARLIHPAHLPCLRNWYARQETFVSAPCITCKQFLNLRFLFPPWIRTRTQFLQTSSKMFKNAILASIPFGLNLGIILIDRRISQLVQNGECIPRDLGCLFLRLLRIFINLPLLGHAVRSDWDYNPVGLGILFASGPALRKMLAQEACPSHAMYAREISLCSRAALQSAAISALFTLLQSRSR